MKSVESKNPVVHAALLGGIALVAAVFLIIGSAVTKLPIAERKQEDLVRSLATVIPTKLYDNELSEDFMMSTDRKGRTYKVYRARKGDLVVAVAFERFVNAYAKVHLIMGVDASGRILGVRVLDHQETPGLGDKIEEKKSPWIRSFDGLSLNNTPRASWGVKKDGGIFDQFSGATITPRAVVKSVREGLEFFRFRKAEFLSREPAKSPDKASLSSNAMRGAAL